MNDLDSHSHSDTDGNRKSVSRKRPRCRRLITSMHGRNEEDISPPSVYDNLISITVLTEHSHRRRASQLHPGRRTAACMGPWQSAWPVSLEIHTSPWQLRLPCGLIPSVLLPPTRLEFQTKVGFHAQTITLCVVDSSLFVTVLRVAGNQTSLHVTKRQHVHKIRRLCHPRPCSGNSSKVS